ncbi:2-dehydropantoate 2-reductase, partial [Litorivivens sp.]
MSDPWLILGAGSIGALWGIRLHQAGKTPTLLLRPEALGRYEGLTLSGEGKFCLPAVSAETIAHPISRLLVCCKSHQTLSALSDIAPHLAPNATVVVVQNGMGVAEQLQ